MPLTLITGPANAAKAGAVLERLRAALAARPGARRPDVGRRRPLRPRARRRRAGLRRRRDDLPAADARHRPDRRRARAAAGPAGPRPGRARRDPRRRAARARRLGRRARASPTRSATCSPSCSARSPRRRASARRCGRGARPARRRRTRASSPRCTPPTTARLEALGAVDADGLARAALDKLARSVGRPAAPALRLRRPDARPARPRRDARPPHRHRGHRRAQLRARPRRAGGQRGDGRAAQAAGARARDPRARSEHYAPSARGALHHLERALFEPEPAQVPPNGAVRLLEAGGERAEAELVGASVLELLRDGMAPEDIAVLVRSDADLFAQVLESYGIPVARDRRTPFAHTRLGTGVLAFARAALGRHRERRRDVAAHAGQAATRERRRRRPRCEARRHALGRPARGRGPRHEARTARDARFWWQKLGGATSSSSTRSRRAAEEGVAPFLNALLAEAEAIWTAPHVRRADVLDADAEADARAARELRAAVKELIRLDEQDPALAGAPTELLDALARHRGARDGAGRGRHARRPARRPAGDPRAALPGDPAVRPAGGRAAAAPAARAVPRRRRAGRAGDRVRARAAAPRGDAPARALAVLRLRLAAGGGAVPVASARATRRAARSRRRRSWTTSARCSPTSCGSGRGRRLLAEITWPPAEAPTPHELRRSQAAKDEAPDPAAAGRARRPGGAARCSPPATASPRAAWRRSPAAR